MSGHTKCECGRKRNDHEDLVVIARNENHSAFNGYKRTWSEYSHVRCTRPGCYGDWRTKAKYVDHLPDAGEQHK